MEADIVIPGDVDGSRADLVDGSIGEASIFHETFGFYAQGMSLETAILPAGWESRLIRYETPATNGVVAWCLSLEDLFVSKALAGRPKDLEFCHSLVGLEAINQERVAAMITETAAPEPNKQLALGVLDLSDS